MCCNVFKAHSALKLYRTHFYAFFCILVEHIALPAYVVYAYCILMGIIKKTIRKQNIRFDIVLNIQVFLMNVEMEYYLNVFLRTVCIKYHITSQTHAHLSTTYRKHFRLANHPWNNNQFYLALKFWFLCD